MGDEIRCHLTLYIFMRSIIIQNNFNRIHQTQGVIMRQYRKQIVWFDLKVKELIFDSSNFMISGRSF